MAVWLKTEVLSLCPQAADWMEDELSLLSRLMVKFPGGTPGRWEKIAHELGRSVTDVSHRIGDQFISYQCLYILVFHVC